MANNVDPDQMLHSAASDLCLHFCKGISVPILRVIMVIFLWTCTPKDDSNQPAHPRNFIKTLHHMLEEILVFAIQCPAKTDQQALRL